MYRYLMVADATELVEFLVSEKKLNLRAKTILRKYAYFEEVINVLVDKGDGRGLVIGL